MILTINEARREFEKYGQETIENMLKKYMELNNKIDLYKRNHPNLVYLLEKDKREFLNRMIEGIALWSSTNYSNFKKITITRGTIDTTTKLKERKFIQVNDIEFKNWLKEKYPHIYYREFELS